jgi:hypothetical protein
VRAVDVDLVNEVHVERKTKEFHLQEAKRDPVVIAGAATEIIGDLPFFQNTRVERFNEAHSSRGLRKRDRPDRGPDRLFCKIL